MTGGKVKKDYKGYEGNVIPVTFYNLFNHITSGVSSLLNTINQQNNNLCRTMFHVKHFNKRYAYITFLLHLLKMTAIIRLIIKVTRDW